MKSDIYGYRIVKEDGISFHVRTLTILKSLRSPWQAFNVENALAAIATCHALDIQRSI